MGGHCQQNKISQRATNEMMDLMVSQKPVGFDLVQNCDLPPPSKLLMRSGNAVTLSMSTAVSIREFGTFDGDDKAELLKALRSSKTRAREAEKMAAILSRERDCLSVVLLQEAMRLFACRQQLRLLQFQVSDQRLKQQEEDGSGASHKGDDDGEENSELPLILALALSFGIGVGTALACRYLF